MSHQAVSLDAHQTTNPIRESKFYDEIKSSTETGDQSTFALLMSMLTRDARELDEFNLPTREQESAVTNLKKQLFIQDRPLIDELSSTRSVALNQFIDNGFKSSVELDLALKPEALLEPKPFSVPDNVINNLELNVKARVMADIQTTTAIKQDNELQQKPNEIDVESWFNVLQESRAFSTAA